MNLLDSYNFVSLKLYGEAGKRFQNKASKDFNGLVNYVYARRRNSRVLQNQPLNPQ
jgi:hypothetical protein